MVRITKYLIIIDLKYEGKYLIVHGLFGYIAIITSEEISIIKDWILNGVQTPHSAEEKRLYAFFSDRRFFISSSEEEEQAEKLIQKLNKRHFNIISHPHTATFIPSYRCNFACPYCFEKDVNRQSPIMTEDQVDNVLELYPKGELNHVCFYGGEPFLPEHKKIISYIVDHTPGVEYSAVTNGYYLNEYIPILNNTKIRSIQVTFDGPEKEHNKTRILRNGKETFSIILQGVEKAISLRLPIKVRMNLSKTNVDSCYEFKKWLTDYFGNSQYLSFDMQELFQYETNDKAIISQKMVLESTEGKENVIFESIPPLARFLYNGEPLHPVINGCSSGIANRIYDPYGNIYSCYLGVGTSRKCVGTYYPKLTYKDNSLLARTADKIDQCRKCKFLFLCGGGCCNPINDLYGDVMHSNCTTMNHVISYLIPQLYRKKRETKKDEIIANS